MRAFKTLQEAYDFCVGEGNIIPKEDTDEDRIRACLRIAKEDLESAHDAITKKRWNNAYKTYYDVIHQLAEALLRFDKIKATNHICLFSYLCLKHPDLEFDWGFFEKIRTKRNGVHYYGTLVTAQDWKEVSLQFSLYIKLLLEKVEEKL